MPVGKLTEFKQYTAIGLNWVRHIGGYSRKNGQPTYLPKTPLVVLININQLGTNVPEWEL